MEIGCSLLVLPAIKYAWTKHRDLQSCTWQEAIQSLDNLTKVREIGTRPNDEVLRFRFRFPENSLGKQIPEIQKQQDILHFRYPTQKFMFLPGRIMISTKIMPASNIVLLQDRVKKQDFPYLSEIIQIGIDLPPVKIIAITSGPANTIFRYAEHLRPWRETKNELENYFS